MTKTLSTVLHVMPPGSGPHTKRQRTGAFNNVSCSAFGGRQNKPKNQVTARQSLFCRTLSARAQESIANLLPFTHVWATSIPALMNKTNVIPAEISPTSLAFLDWLFFYTRETTDGMLEKNVSESFKRMKVMPLFHLFKPHSRDARRMVTRRAASPRPSGPRAFFSCPNPNPTRMPRRPHSCPCSATRFRGMRSPPSSIAFSRAASTWALSS